MAKAIEDAIAALEKKPVATAVQLPQTGDDSNLALWTALLLVGGAAICHDDGGQKRKKLRKISKINLYTKTRAHMTRPRFDLPRRKKAKKSSLLEGAGTA